MEILCIHCLIDSCIPSLIKSLLHLLSERESPASAVGCRRHSIRHRMKDSPYETGDAGDTLSDRGCSSLSIVQLMQETLYQRVDAGVSLSDSGCRRLSIRQRMQETLYQMDETCIRCLIEKLLQPLSDIVSPASSV